jgi:hypothetical protein
MAGNYFFKKDCPSNHPKNAPGHHILFYVKSASVKGFNVLYRCLAS